MKHLTTILAAGSTLSLLACSGSGLDNSFAEDSYSRHDLSIAAMDGASGYDFEILYMPEGNSADLESVPAPLIEPSSRGDADPWNPYHTYVGRADASLQFWPQDGHIYAFRATGYDDAGAALGTTDWSYFSMAPGCSFGDATIAGSLVADGDGCGYPSGIEVESETGLSFNLEWPGFDLSFDISGDDLRVAYDGEQISMPVRVDVQATYLSPDESDWENATVVSILDIDETYVIDPFVLEAKISDLVAAVGSTAGELEAMLRDMGGLLGALQSVQAYLLSELDDGIYGVKLIEMRVGIDLPAMEPFELDIARVLGLLIHGDEDAEVKFYFPIGEHPCSLSNYATGELRCPSAD